MLKINLFIVFLGLIFCPASIAKIYKRVDKNGKVYYSDKPFEEDTDSVKARQIKIDDALLVAEASRLTPIHYNGDQAAQSVVLSDFTLNLPWSDINKVRVGRVFMGNYCQNQAALYWDKGETPLYRSSIEQALASVFDKQGYQYASDYSNLQLKAEIIKVNLKQCFVSRKRENDSKNAIYLKIRWTLFDYADKALMSKVTEGSYDAWSSSPRENGSTIALTNAISLSVNNLLADRQFVSFLQPSKGQVLAKKSRHSTLDIALRYGDSDNTFKSQIKTLESYAVTIKTESGHGSGVLVGAGGYLLTNNHVIKNSKKISVLRNGISFKAEVVRTNPYRDVALLRAERIRNDKGAAISPARVEQSDDIYVMGTPISLDLERTLTKGIISAIRQHKNLGFYQTDANINPGNSGGPVFDQYGELVALSVSGMVGRRGESLGINRLIPIGEALKALNINQDFDPAGGVTKRSKSFLDKMRTAFFDDDNSGSVNQVADQPNREQSVSPKLKSKIAGLLAALKPLQQKISEFTMLNDRLPASFKEMQINPTTFIDSKFVSYIAIVDQGTILTEFTGTQSSREQLYLTPLVSKRPRVTGWRCQSKIKLDNCEQRN